MSSKEKILKRIKRGCQNSVELKSFDFKQIEFENLQESFIKNLKASGGEVVDSIDGFDVILKAKFAVAENGACFLEEELDRKKYTFYESIVIVLNPQDIVNNMYEAYKMVTIDSFGLFMSGPSKTADIEQSLVIGAHGAKRVGVYFVN